MPKILRNIFFKMLTYENLKKAYLKARKGKRYRKDVILFSLRYENILNEMYNNLFNLSYKFGPYNLFYIYEPKERKILSSSFRDRIVHQWYVISFIEPYFIPSFINTTYACIKGRGMHKAMYDLKKCIKKCEKKYTSPYIVKGDIRKFFENIDRNILLNILKKKIHDKDVIKISEEIINSSSRHDIEGKKDKGIPIGNYTSQMFANIYLNELDKYTKHILKCKYYFRYMDDFVLICEDKVKAKENLLLIRKFLNEELLLELNDKTNIFKLKQGVNFCGYKINSNRVRIRNRGKENLKRKLKYIDYMIKREKAEIKEVKEKLMGHIGYICHAEVNNLVKKYFY